MNEFAGGRPWKRFVIVPGADPERAARLVEILLRDGVEVTVANETRPLDRPFFVLSFLRRIWRYAETGFSESSFNSWAYPRTPLTTSR